MVVELTVKHEQDLLIKDMINKNIQKSILLIGALLFALRSEVLSPKASSISESVVALVSQKYGTAGLNRVLNSELSPRIVK